jgi:hypothetical protein
MWRKMYQWFIQGAQPKSHCIALGDVPASTEVARTQSQARAAYQHGFPLGDHMIAWGATHESLAAQGITLTPGPYDKRDHHAIGGRYFDLDVTTVGLWRGSSIIGRPIEHAWYVIKSEPDIAHAQQAQRLQAQFVARWGPPESGNLHVSFPQGATSSQVCGRSEWTVGAVQLAVSWYGAPRAEHGNVNAGFVSITWSDTVAMAAPYLAEWQTRQDALGALFAPPESTQVMARITLRTERTAPYPHYASEPNPDRYTPAQLLAYRVLMHPDRLVTPPKYAAEADERTWLLWRAVSGGAWGVSNTFDTVFFTAGMVAKVEWTHTTPARGGGGECLTVGSMLGSCDALPLQDCDAIRAFIDALQRYGNVAYEFETYTDC